MEKRKFLWDVETSAFHLETLLMRTGRPGGLGIEEVVRNGNGIEPGPSIEFGHLF